MTEDQLSPVLDPNVNEPLLSITEHLPNDLIFISPLTPLSASSEQHHLWMDPESGSRAAGQDRVHCASGFSCQMTVFDHIDLLSARGNASDDRLASCVTVSDSLVVREVDSLFGDELISNEGLQRETEDTQKCCGCGDVFEPGVLNQHSLTNQPDRIHVCNICQRGVKQHEHFTSLQRWRTYCCTEPPKLPAATEFPSTSAYYHSFSRFPPQPPSVFQLDNCGTSYNTYTGFEKHGFSDYPEEPKISHAKLPAASDVWSLATSGAPSGFENPVDFSASLDALASNQWASDLGVMGTIGPASPDTKGWESSLDFPWKEVLSVQLCEDEAEKSSGHPKKNLQPITSGKIPRSQPSGGVPSAVRCTETHLPPVHPKPKSKTRKKTLKAASIPSPPLPSPRAATQRQPRPRPGYLISPSQVALESFGKESNTVQTTKGGSGAAVKQKGRGCGNRTYLKFPPSCRAKPFPSPPQAQSTSCAEMNRHLPDPTSSTVGLRVDRPDGWSPESQLSPLVMPVSVPVVAEGAPFNKTTGHPIKKRNVKVPSKKSHPGLLSSLIMPDSQEQEQEQEQGSPGAGGYPSQLRSPKYLTEHLLNFQPPPYTPPPMLSPVRPGTGLYFSTLPQSQPCLSPASTFTSSQDRKDRITLMMDSTVVSVEPRINVGSRFQAQIPPLRGLLLTLYDEHPAELVWTPWGDLATNPETQKKVTGLLHLCCSSALPGGGTNTELALHCLHEVKGDVLAALDLLLIRGGVYRSSSHPLGDYHYAGSDHWTTQEKRVFRKALPNHNKDFRLIRNELQTKSVTQCVEYYYTMKKLKKFKQRSRGTDQRAGTGERTLSAGIRTSLNRPRGTHEVQSATRKEFTCAKCGRAFHKIKSRSAHMKTHRQQERRRSGADTS